MPQQLGIRRNGFYPPLPTLTGRAPEDMQALRRTIEQLVLVVEQLEDRLSRRLNEMLISGTLANRPAAAIADRIYMSTDQAAGSRLAYDSGTAWLAP